MRSFEVNLLISVLIACDWDEILSRDTPSQNLVHFVGGNDFLMLKNPLRTLVISTVFLLWFCGRKLLMPLELQPKQAFLGILRQSAPLLSL